MKLNLDHIQEFTNFTKVYNQIEQLAKINEEIREVNEEIFGGDYEDGYEKVKDELLDVITASYNMAFMLGLTQDDIDKHKKKLEGYRNSGKY